MADDVAYRIPPNACHLTSRRTSFRSSVADDSLPEEYLEALEQKRRQLDESIHKYIASKEREYKNYEKTLRAQFTIDNSIEEQSHEEVWAKKHGTAESGGLRLIHHSRRGPSPPRRRTSSESSAALSLTDSGGASTIVNDKSLAARQTILLNGARSRRESTVIEEDAHDSTDRAAMARLTNRRASVERDKDFAGLFTPVFLTAIDGKVPRESTDDGTPRLEQPAPRPDVTGEVKGVTMEDNSPIDPRSATTSQSTESAKNKRPSQLQLTSRTSSSGSSADGRLASALKSPTQNNRPSRKRVSLAVGDSIVAPSDSVPPSENNVHHAPSHSRTRIAPPIALVQPSPLSQATAPSPSPTSPQDDTLPLDSISSLTKSSTTPIPTMPESPFTLGTPQPSTASTLFPSLTQSSTTQPSSTIDPDGDLFDLDIDADGGLVDPNQNRYGTGEDESDEMDPTAEVDFDHELAGRVSLEEPDMMILSRDNNQHDGVEYDPVSGLISSRNEDVDPAIVTEENDTVHIDTRPGSATSSRQPTRPGFRRPSVSADPIFAGSMVEYTTAETRAVEEEVYGSRYRESGPNTSSFRGGSLGESFMERNAAELMRTRMMAGTTSVGRSTGELRS